MNFAESTVNIPSRLKEDVSNRWIGKYGLNPIYEFSRIAAATFARVTQAYGGKKREKGREKERVREGGRETGRLFYYADASVSIGDGARTASQDEEPSRSPRLSRPSRVDRGRMAGVADRIEPSDRTLRPIDRIGPP